MVAILIFVVFQMIFNSCYSFIKQPFNDTMKSSRSFYISMWLGRQIPFLGFQEASVFSSFMCIYIYIFIHIYIYIYIFFFLSIPQNSVSCLFPDFSTSVQYLVLQIFIQLHCTSHSLKCCKYSGKSGRDDGPCHHGAYVLSEEALFQQIQPKQMFTLSWLKCLQSTDVKNAYPWGLNIVQGWKDFLEEEGLS